MKREESGPHTVSERRFQYEDWLQWDVVIQRIASTSCHKRRDTGARFAVECSVSKMCQGSDPYGLPRRGYAGVS